MVDNFASPSPTLPQPRGFRLGQLRDVRNVDPTNGYVLLWTAAVGRWEPAQVSTAGIADNAITTLKILDGAVTYAKLNADVLTGLDPRYVNVIGDTMTGQLVHNHTTSPHIDLFNPTNAVGTIAGIATRTGSGWHTRWGTVQGSWWHAFMDGANGVVWGFDGTDLKVGTNRVIHEGNPSLLDSRWVNVTGDTMTGDLRVYRSATPTTGTYYFSQSGDVFLFWNATNFVLNGGELTVQGTTVQRAGQQLLASDGTAANPGIRFNSEASGLYRGAAGQIQLARAGVEALYFISGQSGFKDNLVLDKRLFVNNTRDTTNPSMRVSLDLVGVSYIEFHDGTSVRGDIRFASSTPPEVSYNSFVGAHDAQIKSGIDTPPIYGIVISTGEIVQSELVVFVEERLISDSPEDLDLLRKEFGPAISVSPPVGYTPRHPPPPAGRRYVYIKHPRPDNPSWARLVAGEGRRNAPYIDGTSTPNDSRVYGVYAGKHFNDAYGRSFGINDLPIHSVASLGLVYVLVTDEGGNIVNGNYITSSSRKYYGKRQTVVGSPLMADDVLRNYTVGKSLVDVDWSTIPVDSALGFKWYKLPATLHCG